VYAASRSPAAASISGDGVSPANSATPKRSPPGSSADTARADDGRRSGCRSRNLRLANPWNGIATLASIMTAK